MPRSCRAVIIRPQAAGTNPFRPDTNFIDFGNDVKGLAANLKNIEEVVQNASSQKVGNSIWNLSSLGDIIGNCSRTLTECDNLLREEHKFNRDGAFIYNLDWNLRVQPRIDLLRQRLNFHKEKVGFSTHHFSLRHCKYLPAI
jgi:hypothetical protein